MAVTILSPTSQLIDRSGGVTLSWQSDYPQSAYEVLYRRKGQTAWSTLGRVESAEHQTELDTAKFVDCVEYHYRVVCYAQETKSDADTAYTGSDTSPAYSLILAPSAKAMLKVRGSTGMVEVPLYDDLRGEGPELKVRLAAGLGRAPLVERGSAMASTFSLRASQGIRAAAGRTARCEDPGVPGATELDVRKRYYEAYQYQHQYDYSYKYSYAYTYSDIAGAVGYGTGYQTFHYLYSYYAIGDYGVYTSGYRIAYYWYTASAVAYSTKHYTYSYYYQYYYYGTAYQYQTRQATGYEPRYHYAEQYYNYAIRA